MRLDNMARVAAAVKNFFLNTFSSHSGRGLVGGRASKEGPETLLSPAHYDYAETVSPSYWASSYVCALAESWGFEPQIPLEGILA